MARDAQAGGGLQWQRQRQRTIGERWQAPRLGAQVEQRAQDLIRGRVERARGLGGQRRHGHDAHARCHGRRDTNPSVTATAQC